MDSPHLSSRVLERTGGTAIGQALWYHTAQSEAWSASHPREGSDPRCPQPGHLGATRTIVLLAARGSGDDGRGHRVGTRMARKGPRFPARPVPSRRRQRETHCFGASRRSGDPASPAGFDRGLMPLDASTGGLRAWFLRHGIGVDCSAFVQHALARLLQAGRTAPGDVPEERKVELGLVPSGWVYRGANESSGGDLFARVPTPATAKPEDAQPDPATCAWQPAQSAPRLARSSFIWSNPPLPPASPAARRRGRSGLTRAAPHLPRSTFGLHVRLRRDRRQPACACSPDRVQCERSGWLCGADLRPA